MTGFFRIEVFIKVKRKMKMGSSILIIFLNVVYFELKPFQTISQTFGSRVLRPKSRVIFEIEIVFRIFDPLLFSFL